MFQKRRTKYARLREIVSNWFSLLVLFVFYSLSTKRVANIIIATRISREVCNYECHTFFRVRKYIRYTIEGVERLSIVYPLYRRVVRVYELLTFDFKVSTPTIYACFRLGNIEHIADEGRQYICYYYT